MDCPFKLILAKLLSIYRCQRYLNLRHLCIMLKLDSSTRSFVILDHVKLLVDLIVSHFGLFSPS